MQEAFYSIFPDQDSFVMKPEEQVKAKRSFSQTFRKVVDENGLEPYELGKQLASFLGTLTDGHPKPSSELVQIAFGMIKATFSEKLPSDPMVKDMMKGMLWKTLSESDSFKKFLSGAMNGQTS